MKCAVVRPVPSPISIWFWTSSNALRAANILSSSKFLSIPYCTTAFPKLKTRRLISIKPGSFACLLVKYKRSSSTLQNFKPRNRIIKYNLCIISKLNCIFQYYFVFIQIYSYIYANTNIVIHRTRSR